MASARRLFVLLSLAPACSGTGGAAKRDVDAGLPDGGGDVDAGPEACGLLAGLTATGATVPGRALTLTAHDAGSGRTIELAWDVASGTLSARTGATVTWTLAPDLARDHAEVVTARATASSAGCTDEVVSIDVTVDWPLGERAIVLHNPSAPRSEEVADAYATFRGVPIENRCGVDAIDLVTLSGDAYETFLDAVLGCVASVGEHVHYLVPVFGVPYKVSGRIADVGGGGEVTTSLDALLVYGDESRRLRASVYNPLYRTGDSRAGTYDPFVPFGDVRGKVRGDYFLVARMDGADADATLALVERAAQADALARKGDLGGVVYVDGNRGEPHPKTDAFGSYEAGEWNIAGVERVFEDLGWYEVVADYADAEFGTAPAPLDCPEALYYAGWYSFGNYNDVFTWRPGAIGGHLDSCSACDLRGDRDWSARALRRGIAATFGAVNEPYVAGMPEYDQFFLYLTQGASYGEAAYEATVLGAWMMVWVGDPLYRPYG